MLPHTSARNTVDCVDLLTRRDNLLEAQENIRRHIHDLDQQLAAYMADEGAEERLVEGWKLTYKRPAIWQKDRLTPLLEIIPMEQLVESGGYIPEHQETVPAAWDMRKVLPLARYSAHAKVTIELARGFGLPQLKVERL